MVRERSTAGQYYATVVQEIFSMLNHYHDLKLSLIYQPLYHNHERLSMIHIHQDGLSIRFVSIIIQYDSPRLLHNLSTLRSTASSLCSVRRSDRFGRSDRKVLGLSDTFGDQELGLSS